MDTMFDLNEDIAEELAHQENPVPVKKGRDFQKMLFYWTKSNRLTYSFLSHTNCLKEKNEKVTQNQR